MTVHILCAMRNAAPFIADCLASVRAQTHTDWTMLVRDDGSTDDSASIVARVALEDPRITIAERSLKATGVANAYMSLLQHPPANADVAFIDADDVWLPEHLASSLAALATARGEPALVHGDLELVDAQRRPLHASFWAASGIVAEPSDVRRIAVNNVVTTSSLVLNAALARILRSRPAEGAAFADSWFALAAAATGSIIVRRGITAQYRQHGANVVGAQARAPLALRNIIARSHGAQSKRAKFRRDLALTATQAGAFANAYADLLTVDDREFLARYAALPACAWPVRALGVLTMRAYPGRTLLSAIGEALRC